MSDVKTIKCRLTSSDGGQLLFGRLKDALVEQFLKCHKDHSPFVGINAPDIREWSEEVAQPLLLGFKGVKKSSVEGDFSSVLVVEEDDGNTVEVDLSLLSQNVEEDLPAVDEDGFYFLAARWGSCVVSDWNASIDGKFDPKKLLVKVKKSSDSFLNFRTEDEKLLIGSGNYIYSIEYDGQNASDAVDHEIYDLIHNELSFERVSRVLCIMQVRNNEKSIVYYFDESRDAEKYLPLIEQATLVNPDDDPWAAATRHKVCDFVSLENPHDTNSDWQEHDYPKIPANEAPATNEAPVTSGEVFGSESQLKQAEEPEPVVSEEPPKTESTDELPSEELRESAAENAVKPEERDGLNENTTATDSFSGYLAAAQKSDDLAEDKTESSNNLRESESENQSSMLDYLLKEEDDEPYSQETSSPDDGNSAQSLYVQENSQTAESLQTDSVQDNFSQQVNNTADELSVGEISTPADYGEIPQDIDNIAIKQMLSSESEPKEETVAMTESRADFAQTVSSGPFRGFTDGKDEQESQHTIVTGGAKCPVCGRALAKEDKFCGYCGNNLSESRQFCTNCGTRLRPWANFCSQCGYPVKK